MTDYSKNPQQMADFLRSQFPTVPDDFINLFLSQLQIAKNCDFIPSSPGFDRFQAIEKAFEDSPITQVFDHSIIALAARFTFVAFTFAPNPEHFIAKSFTPEIAIDCAESVLNLQPQYDCDIITAVAVLLCTLHTIVLSRKNEPAQNPAYFNMPSGPAFQHMAEILSYGPDRLGELAERSNKLSNGSAKMKASANKDARKIDYASASVEHTIILENASRLTESNKSTKKIFALVLEKVNAHALSKGIPYKSAISFDLKELVDRGIYKSLRAARTGFDDAADVLTGLKAKATTKRGKRSVSQMEITVLFPHIVRKDGVCTVDLSPHIHDWNSFIQGFFPLPDYAYRLNSRSYSLIEYICDLARQNMTSIKEKGSFRIGFRAIQKHLALPDDDCSKPSRDIKKVIDDCISDIEETGKSRDFYLTPFYPSRCDIRTFLDQGYLEISVTDMFRDCFLPLAKKKDDMIEHARKRQERVVDHARAKALQKSFEKDNSASKENRP